jgi:hypothetical protein
MNNYLKGYLASIPSYDYDKLVTYLGEVMAIVLPDYDLELTLAAITGQGRPLAQPAAIPLAERAHESWNKAMDKVSVDLAYLYQIVDLLEAATNNYSDLTDSYIGEINQELTKIDNLLDEIQLRESFPGPARIWREDFRGRSGLAAPQAEPGLYSDRDGASLPLALVEDRHVTLAARADIDLLHGPDGDTRALVRVLDYCGQPYSLDPLLAIDHSPYTCWDASVWAKEPIHAYNQRLIHGSMVRIQIDLPKLCAVSHIDLLPYTTHPLTVRLDIGGVVSVHENVLDILQVYRDDLSVDRITIELVQENYEYRIVETNPKLAEARQLWASKTRNDYLDYAEQYAPETDSLARTWRSVNEQ